MKNIKSFVVLLFVLASVPTLTYRALAQTYTVVLTTPTGPASAKASQDYFAYSDGASLNVTNNSGELKPINEVWTWTDKITAFNPVLDNSTDVYSEPPSGTLDFFLNGPPASPPPTSTVHSNPTTLQVRFGNIGYYKIAFTATCVFDTQKPDGTTQDTGLQRSASIDCLVVVEVPDYTISAFPDVIIPLESNDTITVEGKSVPSPSPFNEDFEGTVTVSLKDKSDSPKHIVAPDGVTTPGGTSLDFPPNDPSTTMEIDVSGDAKPGIYPLTVFGDSDINAQHPDIQHTDTITLTIPARYAEISCPPYDPPNNSKSGSNTRNSDDGSISVDAVAIWNEESASSGGWYGKGNMVTQNEAGFLSPRKYVWMPAYGGYNADSSGVTYGGLNGTFFTLDDKLTTSLQGGQVLGRSSNVKVKITNFSGTKPYTTSYAINWHYPYENWVKVGDAVADSPEYTLWPSSLSQTVDAGMPALIQLPDSSFNASGIFSLVSAVAGTASPAVGSEAGATAIGLSGPEGAVAATLLAAAGYAIQAASPPTPQPFPVPTSISQFDADLEIQLALDDGRTTTLDYHGNPVNIPDTSSQRMPTGIALAAVANNFADENAIYGGSKGHVTVNVEAGVHNKLQNWEGDSYGNSGFIKRVDEQTKYQDGVFYVYNWKFDSLSPGPRG